MATSLEKLIEMAERLNLKGKEVQEFVKTQQKLEIEAREAERRQKEADRQAELDLEMRKLEIASQSNEVDANTDSHNSSRSEHRGNKNRLPRLPVLGPSDKIDAYLSRFEQYAELSEWPKDLWAVQLSMLLTNKALEVYHRLSLEGNVDYEVLKKTLLKYFDFTEAGFKKRLRESKIDNNETP